MRSGVVRAVAEGRVGGERGSDGYRDRAADLLGRVDQTRGDSCIRGGDARLCSDLLADECQRHSQPEQHEGWEQVGEVMAVHGCACEPQEPGGCEHEAGGNEPSHPDAADERLCDAGPEND
jgi:hypothetical protein